MKALRIIKGVTRRDRLRNEWIRQEIGVMSVLDLIEEWKMRWYGHVMRMENWRYPKQTMEWVPTERRPVGRPRTRWIKGVEEALEKRDTNLPEVQEREIYEDRDAWRRLVKSCR